MRVVSWVKRILVRFLTRATGTWIGSVRPPRSDDSA